MLSLNSKLRTLQKTDSSIHDEALTLRSGTGAPIFEPGPHTRIRRNPVRAIASFTWSDGPREAFGQVVNISLSGCLLRTETTIPEGTELALSITILGSDDPQPLDIRGIVRRQTTLYDRRAYGIEFLTRTPQDRRATQGLYAKTAR